MKKVVLWLLICWFGSVMAVMAADNVVDTEIGLHNIGKGKLQLHITYESPFAVGDPYPNYEYSGHTIKLGSNDYRMIYGGRCVYGVKNDCLVPDGNGKYSGKNTNGGDGDHPRYAWSSDGLNWKRSLTPSILEGKYDTPSVPKSNLDYGNAMDPTVIQWKGTYYMYYQGEVSSVDSPNCPKDPKQTITHCDQILYATSIDLIHWVKGKPVGTPVITGTSPEDSFGWPKAMVVDGQIWLYFGHHKYGYGGQFVGGKLIKSTDPIKFELGQAVAVSSYGGWSQHGLLWPNDPNKRIWVGVTNNWDYWNQATNTGHKVPTVQFSKDGINWTFGDSGKPVAFPSKMMTMQHEFCNIATEVNGGISDGKTFYYCGTFDGFNNGTPKSSIWYSNIMVGRIEFTQLESGLVLGDANADGKVDVVDFSIWKSEYLGQKNTKTADFNKDGKVDILDFGAWKTEYLKNR